MNRRQRGRFLLMAPFALIVIVALACGGDDEEAAETPVPAGTGVVGEKPDDAVQVEITLREWAVQTSQPSIEAGNVYFLVENAGPDDAHEFVIIRSDLGPLDLPFEDDRVPEDQVDIVGEIEPFAPDSSASISVELTPGRYLLICNTSEVEDGEIESHYKKGMVAAFTVE